MPTLLCEHELVANTSALRSHLHSDGGKKPPDTNQDLKIFSDQLGSDLDTRVVGARSGLHCLRELSRCDSRTQPGKAMRVPRIPTASSSSSPAAQRQSNSLRLLCSQEKPAPALKKSASSSSISSETSERGRFQTLQKAKQRCTKAVAPALLSLALLAPEADPQHAQVLSFLSSGEQRSMRYQRNLVAQVSEASSGHEASSARSDSQRSNQSHHRLPLNTNPLAQTPFKGSRAPDFPPSRSRMTLAERASAAG